MIDFYQTTSECHRCHATAWEMIDTRSIRERGRDVPHDVIECVFCGLVTAVPAQRQAVRPRPQGEFRFQFGRFAGLTIAEADREENGRRYLEHLRDTNDKLRDRIAEYLSENDLDSSHASDQIVRVSELSGEETCHERRPSSQRLFG